MSVAGGGGINGNSKVNSFRPAQRTPEEMDAKLRDVSKLYEKQFMREMLKAMRATVHDDGYIKANQAEKIFSEQLDDQYVDKWSDRGGLGFSDIIYNQLIDKFGPQMGIKSAIQKPIGPIQLQPNSNFTKPMPQKIVQESGIDYKFDVQEQKAKEVVSPWSGILNRKLSLEDGNQIFEIRHDNGLLSRLSFNGMSEQFKIGSEIKEGEKIGLLGPDARSFFWNIRTLDTSTKNVSE